MLQILRKSRSFSRFPCKKWPFSQLVSSSVRRLKTKTLKLYPSLPQEVIENMETVTALNIMNDRVSWVVEDTDRKILDYREVILFENPNYIYNHVLYQEKLMDVVNELPDSSIYLLDKSRTYLKSSSFIKFIILRAVIEGVLVTLINATKDPVLPATQVNGAVEQEEELTNKVYVYMPVNYRSLYNLVVAGENLSAYRFVDELIQKGTGPLAGLELPPSIKDNYLRFKKVRDREVFARTLLKADSVTKFCLGLDLKIEEEEEEEVKVE